jgi:hypothetical protein
MVAPMKSMPERHCGMRRRNRKSAAAPETESGMTHSAHSAVAHATTITSTTVASPTMSAATMSAAACHRDVRHRQRGKHRRYGACDHHFVHGAFSFCCDVTSQPKRTSPIHVFIEDGPVRRRTQNSVRWRWRERAAIGNRLR